MIKYQKRSLSDHKRNSICTCDMETCQILNLLERHQQERKKIVRYIDDIEYLVNDDRQQTNKINNKANLLNDKMTGDTNTINEIIHRQHKQTSVIIILVVLFVSFVVYVFM